MKRISDELVLKIRDSQLKLIEERVHTQGYSTLSCGNDSHRQSTLDLEVETTKFIDEEAQKLLMIIGRAGSGKTLFTMKLVAQLWENFQDGDPIPLWINLSQFPETERVVETALKQCLTSELDENIITREINKLRITKKFIIVLDAFDETFRSACPWVFYDLEEWNAKAIFTCRHEYLFWWENYTDSFIVYEKEKPNFQATKVLYINPLNQEQINNFIINYVSRHPDGWNFDQYTNVLTKIVAMKPFIARPYFLNLMLDILPGIFNIEVDEQHPYNELNLELLLAERIIEKWFDRQEKKLLNNRFLTLEPDLQDKFMKHEITLARLMKKKKKYEFCFDPAKESMELYGDSTSRDPIVKLFGLRDQSIQILQSASLIVETKDKHYSFISDCLFDYFVKKYFELGEDNEAEDSNTSTDLQYSRNSDDLLHKVFVNDSSMIQTFADIASDDHEFEDRLIGFLLASKDQSDYATGAANAITILVKKGMRFNDVDLSNVKIPGANISGGFFDRANFIGADLSNVRMNHTWLRGATLDRSILNGVSFGEYPWYWHTSPIWNLNCPVDLHKMVVACGQDVIVWDTNSRAQDFVLNGHQNRVTSVCLSKEGNKVVSGSYDHTIRSWDLQNHGHMTIVGTHDKYVNCVDLSLDGKWIASASNDMMVGIWDVINNKDHRKLKGHNNEVVCVRFTPNSKHLVSADLNSYVFMWETETRNLIHSFGLSVNVNCISFNRTGKLLAMGTNGNSVYIWDFEKKARVKTLRGHDNEVTSVQFNYTSNQLISASRDKTVMVWDLVTEDTLAVLRGADAELTGAYYFNDYRGVIAGGQDQRVRIWEIPTEKSHIRSGGHRTGLTSIQITPSTCRDVLYNEDNFHTGGFISASEDGVVQTRSFSEGEIKSTFTIERSFVKAVVYTKDEEFIILGLHSGFILIREIKKPEHIHILNGHKSEINCLKLSSNDNFLVSCADEGNVRIWDVKLRKMVGTLKHDDRVRSVDFNSNEAWVVTGCNDKVIRVWDVKREATYARLNGHSNTIHCVRFSSDDKKLVSCGRDGKIFVWDIEQKQSVSNFQKLPHSIITVQFCFNDTKIISASEDNSIRLWNVSTSECVLQLPLRGGFSCMAFHADGLLLTGYADGAIDCWDYLEDTGQWLLSWSTDKDSRVLNVTGLTYSEADELSDQNNTILEQHGASVRNHKF